MVEGPQQVGQLVKSTAGRDKGNYYLVYDVLDEAFVRVIDGDKKGIHNPKKKNIKHLKVIPVKAEKIAERLSRGEQVAEEEILEAVKSLGLSHRD